MPRTVSMLYEGFTTARQVADELAAAGILPRDINVLPGDGSSAPEPVRVYATEGGVLSMAQGVGVGMIVGALVGMGMLFVPGIGITAVPWAAAVIGAVMGGIVTALAYTGVPEETIEFYDESSRRGTVMVTVRIPDHLLDDALQIINSHDSVRIQRHTVPGRQTGWMGFDSRGISGQPVRSQASRDENMRFLTYTAEVKMNLNEEQRRDFDSYRDEIQKHYWSHYGDTGRPFEDYLPAYEYGYQLANDQRYSDMEWPRLEPRARLYWEEHFQGAWEDFSDAVAYAWNRVRVAVD